MRWPSIGGINALIGGIAPFGGITLFGGIAPFAAAALMLMPSAAAATEGKKAFAGAEGAVGRAVGDAVLIDQDGAAFNLKELRGKPFALTFIYTGCGHVCPLTLTILKRALDKGGTDFGARFTALTVGFDVENDRPERLKSTGSKVTGDFKKWRFATGDRATVARLVKEAGFYYKKTGTDYEHINLVTIVGPDGRIFRQVYGTEFAPDEILQPLYDSIKLAGRPLPPWVAKGADMSLFDRIRLLCYTYDEKTGTYTFDYGFLIGVAVFIFVQAMILFILGYIFIARKKERRPLRSTIIFAPSPASKKKV